MIAPNSLAYQKEETQGEGEEQTKDQRKEGQIGSPTLGVNARSHKFISFRGVGCTEQENTWTVVWVSAPQVLGGSFLIWKELPS